MKRRSNFITSVLDVMVVAASMIVIGGAALFTCTDARADIPIPGICAPFVQTWHWEAPTQGGFESYTFEWRQAGTTNDWQSLLSWAQSANGLHYGMIDAGCWRGDIEMRAKNLAGDTYSLPSNNVAAPGCYHADLDGDNLIGVSDFGLFSQLFQAAQARVPTGSCPVVQENP